MSVPQYNTLAVKEMKPFIMQYPETVKHLPIEKEIDHLPK